MNYLLIQILDDDRLPVTFHGGSYNITLEIDVQESRVFRRTQNFRDKILLNQTAFGSIESETQPESDAKQQREERISGPANNAEVATS